MKITPLLNIFSSYSQTALWRRPICQDLNASGKQWQMGRWVLRLGMSWFLVWWWLDFRTKLKNIKQTLIQQQWIYNRGPEGSTNKVVSTAEFSWILTKEPSVCQYSWNRLIGWPCRTWQPENGNGIIRRAPYLLFVDILQLCGGF